MGGTRPNPGTALRVVTFRQRQSFPRSDPGQVPAEGGQAAGLEGEEKWEGEEEWGLLSEDVVHVREEDMPHGMTVGICHLFRASDYLSCCS